MGRERKDGRRAPGAGNRENPKPETRCPRADALTHIWRAKNRLPERKGKLCRIIPRSDAGIYHMATTVVFPDGLKVVATSGEVVRRKNR